MAKKNVSLTIGRGEKSKSGGLTIKGIKKYNKATGSNLRPAVTTPPSKLKAGASVRECQALKVLWRRMVSLQEKHWHYANGTVKHTLCKRETLQ